ncbi:hypothetical protein MNBD_GAMMA10-1934 [hydrothermal vent metagenome]|uniref:Uncharacterized protein n=1 Tax=hydrothermal vent metagenome TaxID=652676 RepID=A0A3B0XX52_9ZZZZ
MGHLIKHTTHLLKLIIFLSIGSLMASLMACDNQSDSQYAFITASVEGTETNAPVTKTIVNRQGKNHLPPEVTRIEFDITDSQGVNSTAVLNIGPETQTINFRVFANRDLLIRVDVYSGDTLSFQGESPVAALRPGQTFPFSIEADPVGEQPPPAPTPLALSTGFQAIDKLFTPATFGAFAGDVAIDGDFAYIASQESGLIIANISDINNIRAINAINPFNPEVNRSISDVLVQADPLNEVNFVYISNDLELIVLDISNPLLPVEVSRLTFSETATDLTISGDLAYVHGTLTSTSVLIIDISDPTNISQLGIFQAAARISDISVSAQTLYVYSQGTGVQIVDVSNPLTPVVSALFPIDVFRSYAIHAANNTLYVERDLAQNITGVDIVDVSDINNLTVLSTVINGRNDVQGLHVFNNSLYLVGNTLSVYDISDKTAPALIGNVEDISFTGNLDVANAIYIPNRNDGLKIIEFSDLSTLTSPTVYDTLNAFTSSVAVQNNVAYVAVTDFDNAANSGLHVVDVTDAANPQLITIAPITRPLSVKAAGNFVYVIDNARDLSIVDISVPTSPAIRSVLALQGNGNGTNMQIQNNRLFISTGEVIDVSNPDTPVALVDLNLITASVNNNILTTTDMSFFDISNINSPLRISSYDSTNKTNSFHIDSTAVAGNFAYIAGENFDSNGRNSQFNILDITSITNPSNIAVPSIIGDISNSIEAPNIEGSVRHHTFTLTSPITLSFEIGSESFIPTFYLFQSTPAGLVQLASTTDTTDSINSVTLPVGNYDLAVGNRGLSAAEAQGTINTNTADSINSGSYALHIAPAAKRVGEIPIPGNIAAIAINGNFAYLREGNKWLYVVDISNVANPYITARLKHSGGSSITLEGGNIFIPENNGGVNIYESAIDLQITNQTQTSTTVDFNLSWLIDRVGPGAQFNCGVVVGDCTVTSVDFAARTASVSWTPSVFSGDYGIVFTIGNEQSTIGTRTNIDWVTAQGENPEPERILLNSYIGTIKPNLSTGSIAYFRMLSNKRQNIRVEVRSASFNTHLYVLSPNASSGGFNDFADNDDFNDGLLSSIDTSVFAGEYSLGIGNSILSVLDATSAGNINSSPASGDIGNGLFEIKVYELLGDELIEPALPPAFNRF